MATPNDRRTRTTQRGSSSRMSSRPSPRKASREERTARPSRSNRTDQARSSRKMARGSVDGGRSSGTGRPMREAPSRSGGSFRSSRSQDFERQSRAQEPRRQPRTRDAARTPRPQEGDFPLDEHRQTLFAVPGGNYQPSEPQSMQPQLVSTSVGELRRAERSERLRKSSRRYLMRFIIVIGVVVALLAGWAALYNSPAFTIQHVQVNGVAHLTSEEMAQLANVPEGATLLRVDTETIRNRMMQTAWVEDVDVKRVFPDTLEIDVTERSVQAIVEIPVNSGTNVKQWAIADDHMWLMPIPEEGSEAAKTTSAQIYTDAKEALHIVDVPYGTKAEIGKICTDNNVNNALDIVSGMTTDLSSRVVKVSAAGPAETTLILDDGVEIAFGKAEDIRDKERVILKILEENPDGVAYINVRMVEAPTWRAV